MRRAAAVLLAAGVIGLAACGGNDTTTPSTTTTASTTGPGEAATTTTGLATTTTEAITTTVATADPAALGDRIGDLYLAAYDDLIALLADRPDAAAAAADVAALREQYIQRMVPLGFERETLDAAGRAEVDARVAAALSRLPAETYEAYLQAYDDYAADPEVSKLIASFNILGQYANFDLLRQQAPDEAERLGIG